MNECVNICSSCKNYLCKTNPSNNCFFTNTAGKSPEDYPIQVGLNHKAMKQSNKGIQTQNHNECTQQAPNEIAMHESNKSIQIQNHNECKQQVPTEFDMDTTGSPFADKNPYEVLSGNCADDATCEDAGKLGTKDTKGNGNSLIRNTCRHMSNCNNGQAITKVISQTTATP